MGVPSYNHHPKHGATILQTVMYSYLFVFCTRSYHQRQVVLAIRTLSTLTLPGSWNANVFLICRLRGTLAEKMPEKRTTSKLVMSYGALVLASPGKRRGHWWHISIVRSCLVRFSLTRRIHGDSIVNAQNSSVTDA